MGQCNAASVSSNKPLFAFVTISIDRPKMIYPSGSDEWLEELFWFEAMLIVEDEVLIRLWMWLD